MYPVAAFLRVFSWGAWPSQVMDCVFSLFSQASMMSAENDPLGPLPPGWGESARGLRAGGCRLACGHRGFMSLPRLSPNSQFCSRTLSDHNVLSLSCDSAHPCPCRRPLSRVLKPVTLRFSGPSPIIVLKSRLKVICVKTSWGNIWKYPGCFTTKPFLPSLSCHPTTLCVCMCTFVLLLCVCVFVSGLLLLMKAKNTFVRKDKHN